MAQTCVHKGCQKKYTDPEEICLYHPGPAIFHEGTKGWKCCKPRVLDFDEFLAIPPCTEGKHSTTDSVPDIASKPQTPDIALLPEKPAAPLPAVSGRAPIAAPQPAHEGEPATPEVEEEDDPSIPIPDDAVCKRTACGVRYKAGQSREGEECIYHPGAPIFHEGRKGYTCCKKLVWEFDEFLAMKGCEKKDRHLFVGSKKEEKGAEVVLETIRDDYYQTGATVVASFFLENVKKTDGMVQFKKQTLVLDLETNDAPPKRYREEVPLQGEIDPDSEKNRFMVGKKKVEVTMVKANSKGWSALRSGGPATAQIIQIGQAGTAA